MLLFVVRHAKAHDRGEDWPDDSQRPLTDGGIRKFSRLARAIGRKFEAPEVVLASGYVRAWQTARLLEDEGDWPTPERASWLECDETEPIVAAREALAACTRESIALVGHEPMLSELISEFMGCHGPGVAMAKGAIAVLDVRDPAALGEVESFPGSAAELLCLVDPRMIARD